MSFHLRTSEMRRFLSQSLTLTETSASFNGKDNLNSPTLYTESTCTADLTIEVTEIAIPTLETTIEEAASTSDIVSEDAPASPSFSVHIQEENQEIENNCTDDCNPWPYARCATHTLNLIATIWLSKNVAHTKRFIDHLSEKPQTYGINNQGTAILVRSLKVYHR